MVACPCVKWGHGCASKSQSVIIVLAFVEAMERRARVQESERIGAFEQFIVLAFVEAMERRARVQESEQPRQQGRCFDHCVMAACVLLG